MKVKKVMLKSTILIALVISAMVISGCGNQSPIKSETQQSESAQPFGTHSVEMQWGRVMNIELPDEATVLVGPEEDGEVEIETGNYSAELDIPEGAVDGLVNITCSSTAYLTESGMVYVLDFGPDGLVFNSPAILEIELNALEDFNDGESYDCVELQYWNPDTQQWELDDIDYDIDDGEISLEIDHFSRYGIGGRTR